MNMLPLGSVVLLKDATKKLMIYGRFQMNLKDNGIYDYVGCLYPEGNLAPDAAFIFNNEDIQEVIFEGYVNKEEIDYINAIQEVIDSD